MKHGRLKLDFLWFGLVLVLSGCSQSNDLMPMKVGNTWVYEASTFAKDVRTMKVVESVPVAGASGFRLRSESGETDLVWSGGRLLASKLSGTVYTPPLPILTASDSGAWTWDGTVTGPISASQATAEATQQPVDRLVAGHSSHTTMTTVTLKVGQHTTELVTWFVKGIGIAAQEERLDGALVTKLNFVSGP